MTLCLSPFNTTIITLTPLRETKSYQTIFDSHPCKAKESYDQNKTKEKKNPPHGSSYSKDHLCRDYTSHTIGRIITRHTLVKETEDKVLCSSSSRSYYSHHVVRALLSISSDKRASASVQGRGCFYSQSPGMKQSKCPVMEFTNKQTKISSSFY